MSTALRWSGRWQVATAVVSLLVAANLLTNLVAGRIPDVLVVVAALVATALVVRSGLRSAELGLYPATLARGARAGAAVAGLIALGVAVVALLPLTRDAFLDDRYDEGLGRALVTALVVVPLLTVLPEELAFRGALLGLLGRHWSTRIAIVVSSVLFGLWHVASAWGLADQNDALGSVGHRAQALGVVGAVVVTTAGGVVLCWLRLRTESLLTPIAAHWALNGCSVLAASLVWAAA